MALDFSLTQDKNNGATLSFKDVSTGITYTDIKAVRFQMNNYVDELNETTVATPAAMEQFRLYIKTSLATSIYDLKQIYLSSFYYPFINTLNVLSGDLFIKTGRYSAPTTYLPTAAQIPLIFNLQDWGFDSNYTTFPSRVYDLQYEVYQDTSPTTLSNVTQDKQYIVTGSGTDTATWNGNVYRVGEVFIAQDNGIVTFTVTGNLKILLSSKQKFFTFTWTLQNRLAKLYVTNNCNNANMDKLRNIWVELDSLQWMDYTQALAVKYATDTIDRIDKELTLLESCS